MYTKGLKMVVATAFAMVLTVNVFAADRKEGEAAVSRERAQQVALAQVNGGKVIESEFNKHWFADNDYEFTVVDDTNRYEIRVDAKTGQVKKVEQKAIFKDELSDGERQRIASNSVTPERARQIAMERAPNAQIVEMERSLDDDRVVYDIEMMSANSQVDMTIDGLSGDVLAYDEERLDRRDGRVRLEARGFSRREARETAGAATR